MKSALSCLTFAAAASALAVPSKTNYDGYKVVRVPTDGDSKSVDDMISQLSLPTWQRHNAHIDVMVPPAVQKKFESFTSGLSTEIMHENVGSSILKEQTFNSYAAGNANSTWFESYHPFEDHLQYLADLAEQFPDNAKVVTAEGKTTEGREISGLHLFGSSGGGKKPAIVFHGTVHAREWITTMVSEYIIHSLLEGYSGDEEVKSMLDTYDFYIFPIVNPDGFVFSQTDDRMWRKNRQTNEGSDCVGRDVNRNWPHKWDGQGSSPDPCEETYRGESGGDSPEVKALSAQLKSVKESQGVKAYIDWHSYSQLFMTPYGYSCSEVPDNNDELQKLAGTFVDALEGVHGTTFEYGPICTTIYQTPGSSVDYVQDVIGGDYVFTAELRDTGNYGFILPPEQIVPSGEEIWEGVKALVKGFK